MLAKLICRIFGHPGWVYGYLDEHYMYNERCCSRCGEFQRIPRGDPYYRHFVPEEDRQYCTMTIGKDRYKEWADFMEEKWKERANAC